MMNGKNRGLEVTASSSQVTSQASLNSRTAIVLLCTWIAALLYLGFYLKRGWVPHDEGTFAQCAERVLQGELPHRDFVDNYTGGLTFLNAAGFKIFGVRLASLRFVLCTFFALWVPAVFYIASRFVSAGIAGFITLLAVAWSVPNYPACVPSWYNLYFATFGIAALLRYLEAERSLWLFVAGLCGGLSISIKITGLYFVTATVLFFIYREQAISRTVVSDGKAATWLYRTVIAAGLAWYLFSLARLVHKVQGVDGLIFFVLPSACLAGLLLYREFASPALPEKLRFTTMFRMAAPFFAGVVMPIAIFLTPFVRGHALEALRHDLFYGTDQQLLFAATSAPPLALMLGIVPIAALLIMLLDSNEQGRKVYTGFLVAYLTAMLLLSPYNRLIYGQAWCSLAFVIPALTVAGVVVVGHRRYAAWLGKLRQEQTVMLLAALAVINVVQFPFSIPIYFCYVAPFVILAATALLASVPTPPKIAFAGLGAFFLAFAVLVVTPGFNLGSIAHERDVKNEMLTLPRAGGLRVAADDAHIYEELISTIQAHARGKYIYAAPDCPEVYFLAGLQNPTGTIFDFRDEPVGREAKVLSALKSHNINVVAIHRDPQFSKPMSPELTDELESLYPESEEVGNFQVRWKPQS